MNEIERSAVIEKERATLEGFFDAPFSEMPDLPGWISDELLHYWSENIFSVHYLPRVSLDENLDLPRWRDRPEKIFYKKVREGSLAREAAMLPGTWVLIDGRDKPAKCVPWIRADDVWILEKIGFNPKNYLKRWDAQKYHDEYLKEILQKKGFGSRFCLTISEIDDLKPFISKYLHINVRSVVRLPFFVEYNYLGNAVYQQWRTTSTWEWLADTLSDGRHLAAGSGSVGALGFDPPKHWSTILSFRPLVEL